MQNKLILNIIIANILWSFIPIVTYGLFIEASIITIIVLRFTLSGLILFVLAIFLIYINNKNTDNEPISIKNILSSTKAKNENFYNIRNIFYISILGFFGVILHIIFYFLALKTTTIAFTMIGFQLSIILVAYYEHGVNTEKLDFFKALYLLILIFSIGIIIFVKLQEPNQGTDSMNIAGIFYIILFAISMGFLHIGIGKDSYTKQEIEIINKNKNYKIIRLLVKLSLIFLTGILLTIPFITIIQILNIEGDLTTEVNQFFIEIGSFPQILFRWEFLFLVFCATIIPFLLIFIASVNWSAFNLTYSQWTSILTIIEPIGAVFFGVLLANEYFPIEYLVIVLFLLIISILFRFAHETKNKVNAYILLNKKQGMLLDLPYELLKFNGVCCVDSILGTHDVMVNVKTNSIKELYYLINSQIKNIEGITDIKILFIEKIHKLN